MQNCELSFIASMADMYDTLRFSMLFRTACSVLPMNALFHILYHRRFGHTVIVTLHWMITYLFILIETV